MTSWVDVAFARIMRVSYDKVGLKYLYPLAKEDVEKIMKHIPPEVANVIQGIRFGCNTKTTQEGRMIRRGSLYDIRVNFVLKDVEGKWQSRMLSDRRRHIDEVTRYGGKPDWNRRVIEWDLESARCYACYILLHEIGHVVYLENHIGAGAIPKGHPKQETWCNSFSVALLKRLGPLALCV